MGEERKEALMGHDVPANDWLEQFSQPGENSHPGVRAVRITAENPKWVEVEILRTEDALAADLGVTGINDFGETITSFSELVLGESKVRLLRLTPEPIHSVLVESPNLYSREDAAIYLHAVRLFYLGDSDACNPGVCEHVIALGARNWKWTSDIDAAVMAEAIATGHYRLYAILGGRRPRILVVG